MGGQNIPNQKTEPNPVQNYPNQTQFFNIRMCFKYLKLKIRIRTKPKIKRVSELPET